MFAAIYALGIAASGLAREFSPRVETVDDATVVMDISGLERLLGTPKKIAQAMAARAGPRANIAIAPNRDAALHAARGYDGVVLIPPGEEAARLGGLPIEVLHPSEDILETFDRWGIRTFRDLAGLPEVGLAERLGSEGVRLQKLARGEPVAPLDPKEAVPEFRESMELEHPIELLEPLSFVISRLLNDVCRRLEEHGQAALELRLTLRLENKAEHLRALRLPVPMRSPITFLKLIQLDLAAHPPAAPVVGASIAVEPAKPRALQEGLFLPPAPEPEKLELTLKRIAAIVGESRVGTPQLVDTHRPGAFRVAPAFEQAPFQKRAASATDTSAIDAPVRVVSANLAFRVFRPPLDARVDPPAGPPERVRARNIQGSVLALAGPWRTSGDWWTPDPWARDDWDVALSDGALYRIYSEYFTQRWFVEGCYD